MAFCEIRKLLRDRSLLRELGVAIEVNLGVLQVRLVAVTIGDRLIELCLIRSRVDLREHIAVLHKLTLVEADLDKLPGDLAADEHVVVGDHRADAAQVDRNIMALH